MIKRLLLSFLLALLFTLVHGQEIKRSTWTFGPTLTFTNNVYGFLSTAIVEGAIPGFIYGEDLEDGMEEFAEFKARNQWWFPSFRQRFDIMKSVKTPSGNAPVLWRDWGVSNIAAGYQVTFRPYNGHFGFDVEVQYERQSWKVRQQHELEFTNYIKHTVSPQLVMDIRFGDYARNTVNFYVDLGARYNYTFDVAGGFNSTKQSNNGVTGIAGFGLLFPQLHSTMLNFRYEHDFYNYFNQNYTDEFGNKPFDGFKTKHGALVFGLTCCF